MRLTATDNRQAIRGHHGSAISHITSGVNIFAEMNGREKEIQPSQQGSRMLSSKGYVSLAHLQVLFNRLDFQKLQVRDHSQRSCRWEG